MAKPLLKVGVLLVVGACIPSIGCGDDDGSSDGETGTETVSQEVLQPGSDLVWQRCPLGQTFDGAACTGSANSTNWNEASTACPTDFRLPTRQEFIDLLGGCDEAVLSGTYGNCSTCAASNTCNTIFPSDTGWYWSSSQGDVGNAWSAAFRNGKVDDDLFEVTHRVRCVRTRP
ncbi:MAG: DUF1566 domain-containing protein [Myxococcota bacterium]|nr:DUF1566 domain-containing protein [Myxococcota bacterium]